jgi:hypothetical protein
MHKTSQEQKIDSAISELIDQVERFSRVARLRFIDISSDGDDIGPFIFLTIVINLRHHVDHLVAEAFFGCYLDRSDSQLQSL